jgi:hypothetical protein
MVDKGLYVTCPNGGWWQEGFFALWDELAGRYEVDGLFFNAWGHKERTREGEDSGPCHCPTCVRLFRERYGRDLPGGGGRAARDDPATWLNRAFRRETLDALGRRIYAYVKARRPEVAVFAGAGHRALLTGQADCTEIELHCGSTADPAGNRWRHAAGESCKLVASLGPGFASGINAVYCHVGPGRWRLSAAPRGWLGYTLAQALANAGWPYCMMIGTLDNQPDRSALPLLREVLSYARDHEALYRNLTSAARIGLVWSQRSAEAAPGWTSPIDGYVKHFRGWYDLLTRRRRLFDVVADAQLAGEGGPATGAPGRVSPEALLDRYPLLVLPNPVRLGAEVCRALDAYVALGGRLLATGAPPLAPTVPTASTDSIAPAAPAGLTCLGATEVIAGREGVSNSYFRIRPADRRPSPASGPPGAPESSLAGEALPGIEGLEEIDLLPVVGRLHYVAPREGARAALALIPPEDYGAPEQTVFPFETSHPGLLWLGHGAGVTAYLPWEPDRAWFETGSHALGELLDALVGHLAPPPAVALDGPESVELTAHRQAGSGRLLVHLVNGSGGAPPRWADPAPLEGLRLRLTWPGPPGPPGPGGPPGSAGPGVAPRVRALRAGVSLTPEPAPGGFALTLPTLGLFEAIAVDP